MVVLTVHRFSPLRGEGMIYTVVALKKGYEQPNFACDFSLPYDVNVGLLR